MTESQNVNEDIQSLKSKSVKSQYWTETTLGEICNEVKGIIKTGPFGAQLRQSNYTDEGLPVIMPKDLVNQKVSTESIVRIGNDNVTRLSQYQLKKGDVVYGRRGDIGRCALITERENGWLCGTGCLKISLGESILNSKFLYYYLTDLRTIAWIYNRAIGATLPNLNTSIIRSIPITYPPLPAQQKIASILSAYDDLIENNTRRIKILEAMAQMLYREWFVNFRFPDHEQVKMVESELGLIPEGWEHKILGDIAQEIRRGINPEKLDPETPYFGLEHLPRKSIALSDWGKASDIKSTKLVFKKGEILFGKIRPYFHKVGVAPINGICSSDIIVIQPKDSKYFSITLACVSSEDFVNQATQTSQGTKMPRANWDVLTKYTIVIPPSKLFQQFNKSIEANVQQIQNLVLKNINLRKTRDLLLPKLISGEIDVEKLGIDTLDLAA